ncbi:E3 ubiquitin-protein ligase TM129-like [Strongylocentrotus purpuratus]|uniref:Transmembrane protein 129 n=1 Tax=Strongylocentrotus purpuratus TaxID=7668 RepID=A0A7M7HEG2_STRPU|nr:E3 ubiquitin-protein ligase TM129-like [Strongylocentrotus purpuratus]|eukprot:XP_011662403.1 PREDICTED: E3 ubiquitin-protein ligase TM129-like [Strongylocentrotus purpuratus]
MYQASADFVFTLVYMLLSACLVVPPSEFRSAGLTIQNLLSSWLGSEELHFVQYHIKRTTATIIFHTLIPLGYYIGFGLVCPEYNLFQPWKVSSIWLAYLITSVLVTIIALVIAYYWSRKHWSNHPVSATLGHHDHSWWAVCSNINIEFRRINKFSTGPPSCRVYVTDSWIIRTSAYSVCFAHKQDCHLNILQTVDHALSHESSTGVQILTIEVVSINRNIKPFQIRLNALDFRDLKDKVSMPIVNARNVVIQQTLTDRFLEAFRQQVDGNQRYALPDGAPRPEACIGCLQTPSNVKLVKLCDDPTQGECVQCYCRPMWCLECLCKWWVSRQQQDKPETWLGSRSPCPTCRSKFCLLDVCNIAT